MKTRRSSAAPRARPRDSAQAQELAATEASAPSGRGEPLPELMTVGDFLERFRISRTSFYREVEAGRLRIVKFGTATRIARSEAERWMAELPSGGRAARPAPAGRKS